MRLPIRSIAASSPHQYLLAELAQTRLTRLYRLLIVELGARRAARTALALNGAEWH